jgi:hypothetical protein
MHLRRRSCCFLQFAIQHGVTAARLDVKPPGRWRFDELPYVDCLETLTGTVRETRQRKHGDRAKVSVTRASLDARVNGRAAPAVGHKPMLGGAA